MLRQRRGNSILVGDSFPRINRRNGIEVEACRAIFAAETLHICNPNKANHFQPKLLQIEMITAGFLNVSR